MKILNYKTFFVTTAKNFVEIKLIENLYANQLIKLWC